jgi:hypothetical protein
MSTPPDDGDFLRQLEADVRDEITQAEARPDGNGGAASADDWMLAPDAQRYDVALRTLLGATEAMEDGTRT